MDESPGPDLGPFFVQKGKKQRTRGGRGGSANSQMESSRFRPQQSTPSSNAATASNSRKKPNQGSDDQPSAKVPKRSVIQQIEELEIGGRKILAQVTNRPNPQDDFFCLVTLGSPRENVPSGFKVTAETKVINIGKKKKSFAELAKTVIPGTIYEINSFEPAEVPPMDYIAKWPNHDLADAKEVTLQIEQGTTKRLTMVTCTKDKKFVDPIQKTERRMGNQFVYQIDGMHDGKVVSLQVVKFAAGTKYTDANQSFFTPLVQLPINFNINEAVRHEVCAIIKASSKTPQYDELKLDANHPNKQNTFKDVGRAIWLALTVVESKVTQEKKSCTYMAEDAQWEIIGNDVKLSIEILATEKINMKNFAQSFTKGALACVRDGKTISKMDNKPLTMLVEKTEFVAALKKVTIRLITPLKLLQEVFELKAGEYPPKKIQLSPSSDQINGKELAIKLMKNDVPMFEKGKPELPQKIFKAVLKVPLNKQGIHVVTKATDIPEFLTEDQRRVVIEAILKNHAVILCQAVAGSGKTTVIVELIKLLRKRYPDKTPVMISTGNAPVQHVALAFADEEFPPLLVSSMAVIKKLSPEEAKKIEKFTFLSYIIETLKVPDLTEAEKEKLEKAMAVEATLQSELMETMADGEIKDAINSTTYVYDDLLGAYQSQFDDYEEDEETPLAPQPEQSAKKEQQDSRAKILKEAIVIIQKRRPPVLIAGTAVMITRLGTALNGISDTLIVDEAATVSQINLLAALHEIQTISSLVMVGDTNQLKVYTKNIHPCVLKMGFESALDVLQQNTGTGVISLNLSTTFRFHPLILKMINEICYFGLNLTTPITAEQRPGLALIFKLLNEAPILLIHCDGEDSPYFPLSSKNDSQTKMAEQIVQRFAKHGESPSIITLYNGQKMVMKQLLEDSISACASVDSFQGQEAKYLLNMTTKTEKLQGNKFFNNFERRTVALTRAQNGLIVLGDVNALRVAPAWSAFVKYCEQNSLVHYQLPPEP